MLDLISMTRRSNFVLRAAWCAAIFALSMLSSFSSPTLASDVQTYLRNAAIAVGRLDFEQALEIYSEGLEQQPGVKDQAELLLMRGITADLANKSDRAEADFTEAVRLIGDTDPRAYRERGLFYFNQRRLELSLADYTAGARLFPRDGVFPNGQGLVLNDQEKFEEALSRFDEAIRLDPASGVFLVGRAEAYNRSDRPKAALEDYDRALALGHLTKNETARLRTGAGSAHLKLRNYKAAIENFNTALELRPNHINAMKWRGLAFQAIDETDSAARDYDGVLKLKPTDEWTMKRVQALRKKETEPRASPNKP